MAKNSKIEVIRNKDEVENLVTRINSSRQKPIIVISTVVNPEVAQIDPQVVAGEVGDIAEINIIETGNLTFALADLLPIGLAVFSGAARSYPVDFAQNPSKQTSPLRFPGPNAAQKLASDALTHAHRAGLFQQTSASRVEATGVVSGFLLEGTRALIDVSRHGLATVAEELTAPPVPLEWIVKRGQNVTGVLELEAKRFLLSVLEPSPEQVKNSFPHGVVTLALARNVTSSSADLFLHPNFSISVRREDISPNPYDTVDLLIAEGDVVSVRIRHLSTGDLHFSMYDVDEDEQLHPALPLTEGGPPWLQEGRGLVSSSSEEIQDEMAAEIESLNRDFLAMGRATSEFRQKTTASRKDPVPKPGAYRVQTEEPLHIKEDSSESELVQPVQKNATALQNTQLQLLAAQSRIKDLEKSLSEAGADDSAHARLIALRDSANARLRETLIENSLLKQKNAELREQQKHSTTLLRNARRVATTDSTQPRAGERMQEWNDDKDWVRHEIYSAWVERFDAPSKAEWRLPEYAISDKFADSLIELDQGQFQKAMRAVVDVLTGYISEVTAREVHPLKAGAGTANVVTRAEDNALCMRAYVEQGAPQARRLHYWQLPAGGIELSRVVKHDDMNP